MPYVNTICQACGESFPCLYPERYEMCEDCETEYRNSMSRNQDIDWHQEQKDLA